MQPTREQMAEMGERIQAARLAVGYDNQSAFCRLIGTNPPTLYRWERGQMIPKVHDLVAVARACRVTVEWLVTGEDTSPSDALREWLETPTGEAAPPEARAFLESLPLHGYRPTPLFFDLAYSAWQHGLSRDDARRAAMATEARR